MWLETLPSIVDEHVEECAVLHLARRGAVVSPAFTLPELTELDLRLDAHADGLRLAGRPAVDALISALDGGEVSEVFAAAVIAFTESPDLEAAVLDAVAADPTLASGLADALVWTEPVRARERVATYVRHEAAGVRAAAFDAASTLLTGDLVRAGLTDADPVVRRAALRAAVGLGDRDLTRDVDRLRDDAACRTWALVAACRYGDRRAADALADGVDPATPSEADPTPETVLAAWVRASTPAAVDARLAELTRSSAARLAAWGYAVSGRAETLDRVLALLDDTDAARRAGFAFATITGTDLAAAGLEGAAPGDAPEGPTDDPDDDDVGLDPDDDFPWPDADLVRAFWRGSDASLPSGVVLRRGHPSAHALLADRDLSQLERCLVRDDLLWGDPSARRAAVDEPGFRQAMGG